MRKYNKWLIFLFVGVGIFMSTLDSSIVNVTLPVMTQELKCSLATIEWVIMIYLLTVTALLLSFGRLSDIKGRRWVYATGLILFCIGSWLCANAQLVSTLISARAFQGIGAAMVMACTPALVVDVFPVSERGKALGLIGSVVALGLTVGPPLGGVILHYFSWRFIFLINIPIGILAAFFTAIVLKGGPADIKRDESFDWPGAICLSACLGLLLFILNNGYQWGYFSLKTLGSLLIFLCLLILLTVIEHRTKHPLLEFSLFYNRLFTLPVMASVILFSSLFTIVFLMPFYLIHPCGFEVSKVGYIMSALFIGLFIFSPISGTLSDHMGSRFLCTLGMALLAGAMFLISRLTATAEIYSIIWRLMLAGTGTAIFISPNSSVALSSVPVKHRGIAAGTVAMARNLGMVIGVAFAGATFNSVYYKLSGGLVFKSYNPSKILIFMASFRQAMTLGSILAILGVLVTFLRGKENNKELR